MISRGIRWLCVAVLMLGVVLVPTVTAQSYPEREIRMVVPLPPGGGIDVMARTLQAVLADMGVRVVVDNRAGGGTAVGLIDVAQSRADGYTVGVATTAILSLMALEQVPLQPSSLEPITRLSQDPLVLMVRSDAPWGDIGEFMQALAADPASMTIGHPLINNPFHANAVLTGRSVGVAVVNVPFDGGAPVAAALLGGHLSAGVFLPSLAVTYIQSGDLRALAVYDNEPLDSLPDVPAFPDAGFDVFAGLGGPVEQAAWVVVPAGTDPEIKARLGEIIQRAVASEQFQNFARNGGFVADGLTGASLEVELAALYERLGTVMPTLLAD